MYNAKKFISYMALCVLIFSLCACGEKGSENAAIYGETVGGLEDNELFAIIDANASLPVLLVTSQVYNDGLGNQAALNCDVYYLIDNSLFGKVFLLYINSFLYVFHYFYSFFHNGEFVLLNDYTQFVKLKFLKGYFTWMVR